MGDGLTATAQQFAERMAALAMRLVQSEEVSGGAVQSSAATEPASGRSSFDGTKPESSRDAAWGERFFHVTDPDGHKLSFAERLPAVSKYPRLPVLSCSEQLIDGLGDENVSGSE